MRCSIVLTLVTVALVSGCASRPAPAALAPTASDSADIASDPSWTPPESSLVVGDRKSDDPGVDGTKAKTEAEHVHIREHDSRRGALHVKKPDPSPNLPSP